MFDKLKNFLKILFKDNPETLKLIDDNLKEEDFKEEKTPATKYDKDEIAKAINAEKDEKIDQLTKLLNNEIEERKKRDEALKEEAEKSHSTKVKEAIEKAIKEGKIPSQNEDVKKSYEALLKADFTNGSKIIEALPSVTKSGNDETKTNTNFTSQDKEADLVSKAKSEIASKLQIN